MVVVGVVPWKVRRLYAASGRGHVTALEIAKVAKGFMLLFCNCAYESLQNDNKVSDNELGGSCKNPCPVIFFSLTTPTPPHPYKPPGPHSVRFGSFRVRLGPFRVRFGSFSGGVGVGSGWGRGGGGRGGVLSCTRLRVPPVALHVSQLLSWIL